MALKIITKVDIDPSLRKVIARERLFLTADRTRLVSQDQKDAAFLFCTPGVEILESDAVRFGLLKEEVAEVPKREEPEGEKRNGAPLEAPQPPVIDFHVDDESENGNKENSGAGEQADPAAGNQGN